MTPLLVLMAIAGVFAAETGWVVATYLMAFPAGAAFYLLTHGEM